MRNGGDDVCPSQRKSHEHDEKVNHDEKEVIFPRPVNLTSIWKNDYRDCTQYHHQGKKKKHVSAILEVYIAQLATRQANEVTHMVSIYLLLIQFKIPAERSTFLCRRPDTTVCKRRVGVRGIFK
jgi:hypothetical protein